MLIVEDDEHLSRGMAFAFERDGYEVVTAGTLGEALKHFESGVTDIIILDLSLPDGSGMELCKSIRVVSRVPIVMLTARDLETDEVTGLMAGADDYITKPFSLAVLRARVEAVLRRMEGGEDGVMRSGALRLDTNMCKLWRGDEAIPLSATEFRLIKFLMQNAGRILSKEQILAALWDNQGQFVDENTLQVNISRLRAKIEENPKGSKVIKTIHGMGYVWVKE